MGTQRPDPAASRGNDTRRTPLQSALQRECLAGAEEKKSVSFTRPDAYPSKKVQRRDASESGVTVLQMHVDKLHQEMHSFGCCDSYGTEVLGERASGGLRERVSHLLFSSSLDDVGQPKGIGLSGWRFRLGAGSARTGECAPHQRYDTFLEGNWDAYGLDDERSYDFTRCAGRRWFLHAARKAGLAMFTASVYAPPVTLTGAATNSKRCSLWLPDASAMQSYEFATYVVRVLKHFGTQGVQFTSVSPARATHTGGGVAEGCLYSNQEYLAMVHSLALELDRLGLPVRIVGPDCMSLDFLTNLLPGHKEASNFLKFFRDASVGNTQSTEQMRFPDAFSVISSASYLSCWPEEGRMVQARERLRTVFPQYLNETGMCEYWVSEYTIKVPQQDYRVPERVSEGMAEVKVRAAEGDGKAELDLALHMARVIMADLVLCNASSWNWGCAVGTELVPDGLVSVDTADPTSIHIHKLLWAYGHFSFFIRPGYVRIATTRLNDAQFRDNVNDLLDVAFIDDETLTFVVVVLNMSESDRSVKVELRGRSRVIPSVSCFTSYLTSRTAALTRYKSGALEAPIECPARSIVTLRGDLIEEGTVYLLRAGGTHKLPLVLQASQKADGLAGVGPEVDDNAPPAGFGHDPSARRVERERQTWKVVPHPDGDGVMLQSTSLGVVLMVRDENEDESGILPVHFALPTGDPSHLQRFKWRLRKGASGAFVIISCFVSRVLECYGDVVRLAMATGKVDQSWDIVPAEKLVPEPLSHHHTIEERKARAYKRGILTPALYNASEANQGERVDVRMRQPGPNKNKFSHKEFFASQGSTAVAEEIPVATQVPVYKNPRYAVPHGPTQEDAYNAAVRPSLPQPLQPHTIPYPRPNLAQTQPTRPSGPVTIDTLQESRLHPASPIGSPRAKEQVSKAEHPSMPGGVASHQRPPGRKRAEAFPFPPTSPSIVEDIHDYDFTVTSPTVDGSTTPASLTMLSPRWPQPQPLQAPSATHPLSPHATATTATTGSSGLLTATLGDTFPTQQSTAPLGDSLRPLSPGMSTAMSGASLFSNQDDLDRRRQYNATLRKQRLSEEATQRREAQEQRISEETAIRVREEQRRREKEEEERAKRRGTSHLVLSLSIEKKEFNTAYQRAFRSTVAKQLGINEHCVLVSLIGGSSSGIKVEVRLRGVDDIPLLLDRLYEAFEATELPAAATSSKAAADGSDSASDLERAPSTKKPKRSSRSSSKKKKK